MYFTVAIRFVVMTVSSQTSSRGAKRSLARILRASFPSRGFKAGRGAAATSGDEVGSVVEVVSVLSVVVVLVVVLLLLLLIFVETRFNKSGASVCEITFKLIKCFSILEAAILMQAMTRGRERPEPAVAAARDEVS